MAASAGVRVPEEREAMTKTCVWAVGLPRRGVASVAACCEGAVEGRNWLLSLFTSLPSEGRARALTTMSTIQASTTRKR